MLKLFIYFILILLLFAIIPETFWQWLKPYFNWEILLTTIKKGWENFIKFIQESSGINFNEFFVIIKKYIGIDILSIINSTKNILANFFLKISNFFSK